MHLVSFSHSAKGSTWEDHKYVKRIDGTYYYPSGYTKGRTVDSLKDTPDSEETTGPKEESDLSEEDVENLALEVIRGNFANGQERKEALGEYYSKVQTRVNQLMKTIGSKSISETVSPEVETTTKKAVEKASNVVSGVDMKTVYSVYNKKKK